MLAKYLYTRTKNNILLYALPHICLNIFHFEVFPSRLSFKTISRGFVKVTSIYLIQHP